MRFVGCSLGCGAEMREKDRDVHEQVQCLRRLGGGERGRGGLGSAAKKTTKTGTKNQNKKMKKKMEEEEETSLPTIESMKMHDKQQQKQKRAAARGQNPATQKAIDSGSRAGTPVAVRTAPNTPANRNFRGSVSRQSLPDIER